MVNDSSSLRWETRFPGSVENPLRLFRESKISKKKIQSFTFAFAPASSYETGMVPDQAVKVFIG